MPERPTLCKDPAFELVVTQVVDLYSQQIRDKATRDNADLLDKNGFADAAKFLRAQISE